MITTQAGCFKCKNLVCQCDKMTPPDTKALKARVYFVKATGGQLKVPVEINSNEFDTIDLTTGDDRWIYTVIQSVDPTTNPTSMKQKWLHLVEHSAYESLRSELDSMIEGSNHLSTHNAELDLEITELESKLEFMNKNCISLGLHDSRVQALEQENERLLHFQPNTLVVKIKELEQENKRIESLNSKLQLEVHDQDMKIIELEQLITQVDKYGKEKLITELDEELTISEKKLEKAVEQRNLLANSVLNSDVQVICADIDIMILDEQIASIKGSGV